jgi:hypothetical protein
LFYVANGMAGFMDFGFGVLIVAVLGFVFGNDLTVWHLVLGGVFAFLPDFDIIPTLVLGKMPKGYHHETLMHRPLLVLPTVVVLGLFAGGSFWSLAAFLCVFYHYVHDSPECGGGGIAWLWPFSKKFWSLSGKAIKLEEYSEEHGAWLERYWLRPSWRSGSEITFGSIALAVGLSLEYGTAIGFVSLLVLPCTLLFWVVVHKKG